MKKKTKKKGVVGKAPIANKKLFFLMEKGFSDAHIDAWINFTQQANQSLYLLLNSDQEISEEQMEKFHGMDNVSFINAEATSHAFAQRVATTVGTDPNSYVCLSHWEKLEDAKQAAVLFNQHQSKLQGGKIGIPVLEESPKLGRKVAYFFAEFFYPTRLFSQPIGTVFIPTKQVGAWLQSFDEANLHTKNLPQLVAHTTANSHFDIMPLPTKNAASLASGQLVKASVQNYFKSFTEKFVREPLAEFSAKPFTHSLKEGNSGLYRFAFLLISALLLLLMPMLSFDYGMTWDEPVLVEYAEDIIAYYASGGEDKGVFDMKKHARNATMHYSASFDLLAALVHKYISPFGIYETRHLLNAFFGALLMLFIGRIGAELGNWRIALLALLFALLSPRLFGHSMNNPKDIPFAFGYAMSMFYMLRFFKQLPKPNSGTFFWLIVAMAFFISIKIGGLLVIGYLGLLGGIVWLFQALREGFPKALANVPRYALYLIILIIPSYLLGILFWPWGIEKPLENPITSLTEFTNFRFLITYELFEGERINMDSPPMHYTFKWIGISVPLFVLAGFFFSLLTLPKSWAKYEVPAKAMLLFTLFFPVVYTIVQNSTLYSGWRHLMFVYVPLVALAASGWEYFFNMKKVKAIPIASASVLGILLLLPAIWMVRNHPNQYVYFNELTGGINGAYTEYETEYWCNTMKQAVHWLIENEPVEDKYTYVAANFEINTAQYYANKKTDSLQMLWTRENEKYKQRWDYAFFGTRGMSKEMIENTFPPKGTIHTIKADSVPLLAIVKRDKFYIPEANEYQQKGNLRGALNRVNDAIQYDPNNVEALRKAGLLYLNIGQDQQAVNTLTKCLKLNPDDYVAYMLIGIARYNQKEYDQAIPYLQKSVSLKVNNSSGYHHLGRTFTAKNDYEQALKYFEQAVKYDNGRNPAIFYDAALALMQQGLKYPNIKQNRFELAIRNLQLAVEKNPNMIDAYRNLAYAYQELGDQQRAAQYMAMFQQRGGS